MRLRSRLMCVLAIVGLWFVVPSQLAPEARADVGHELVEQWLLGADSPLPKLFHDGRLPELAVDLRTSPPTTDPEELAQRTRALASIGLFWAARAGSRLLGSGSKDWPLLVRIGEHGVQAELPLPDGSTARWVRPLPTRWSLLSGFAIAALAVLGVPLLVWLFASTLATFGMLWALALPGTAELVWPNLLQQVPTSDVLLLAALPVSLAHDWRPATTRDRPDAPRMLLVYAFLVFVVAGQRQLEVGLFAMHQGVLALVPLIVAAGMGAYTTLRGGPRLAQAAALLLVTPLLSRSLGVMVWLVYSGFLGGFERRRAHSPGSSAQPVRQ